MADRIINSSEELDLWIRFLVSRKLPITVSSIDGRDRSGQQNALQWLWATEASRQLGDRTAEELQREWKLRHGVPILREDSREFRESYRLTIKPLTYEQKLEAMRFIDITSLFKVRQMVRYLDAVGQECAEQGVTLTEPDPALASYQSRYRSSAKDRDTLTKEGERA